jgi:hypothetical protein
MNSSFRWSRCALHTHTHWYALASRPSKRATQYRVLQKPGYRTGTKTSFFLQTCSTCWKHGFREKNRPKWAQNFAGRGASVGWRLQDMTRYVSPDFLPFWSKKSSFEQRKSKTAVSPPPLKKHSGNCERHDRVTVSSFAWLKWLQTGKNWCLTLWNHRSTLKEFWTNVVTRVYRPNLPKTCQKPGLTFAKHGLATSTRELTKLNETWIFDGLVFGFS